MLADAMCKEINHPMKYEYDRHAKREKRTRDEIGIHAVRGGTIVGEHEIIFLSRDRDPYFVSLCTKQRDLCRRRCERCRLYVRKRRRAV